MHFVHDSSDPVGRKGFEKAPAMNVGYPDPGFIVTDTGVRLGGEI